MTKVLIEWSDTHHPRDDLNMIESALAAGGDEGPLIVIPTEARRGPGRRQEIPAIFKDVYDYLGHLAQYDGDVGDERFVGLVRSSEPPDWDRSFSALLQIQQALAPGTDGIPKRQVSKRETVILDYRVIAAAPLPTSDFEIESVGDGLPDVLDTFPCLKPLIGGPDGDEDEW